MHAQEKEDHVRIDSQQQDFDTQSYGLKLQPGLQQRGVANDIDESTELDMLVQRDKLHRLYSHIQHCEYLVINSDEIFDRNTLCSMY